MKLNQTLILHLAGLHFTPSVEGNPARVFTPAQKTFMKWTPGIEHKMYLRSQLVTDNFGWWICQMYRLQSSPKTSSNLSLPISFLKCLLNLMM